MGCPCDGGVSSQDGWLSNATTNPQALFSKDGLGKLVGSQEVRMYFQVKIEPSTGKRKGQTTH